MDDKSEWPSWLGYFKVVPLSGAIASGAFSVAKDAVFLISGRSLGGPDAFWTWLRVCFVISSAIVWYQQHRRLGVLEQRLKRRIEIRNLTPRVWPAGQGGIPYTGKEYYFDVFNASETESLENVRAEVASLVPDAIGYPDAPLHIRNETYEISECSINPRSSRKFDLATGPVVSNNGKSQWDLVIPHTVNKYRTSIPHGKYKLTVQVSAKNTRPERAVFEIWIDTRGEVMCVQL